MAAVVLLIVSLLRSFEVQGSENVFVKSGSDLFLDVKTEVQLIKPKDFVWKHNNIRLLKITYEYKLDYFEPNVEAFVKNFSLLLKNVQHDNSGVYTAVLSAGEDTELTKYNVTVQDPVSPVSLLVTTNSFGPSCNFSVTCRTNLSKISQTFTCDKTCSASEASVEETHTSPSLDVYLERDYVICNHSNQVSSSLNKTRISPHCELTVPNTAMMIGIGSGVPLVLCLLCALYFIIKKCKRKSSPEQTVYDVPQNAHPTPNEYSNPTEATSDPPLSVYALVQFASQPEQQGETPNAPQIESVYAQVNRKSKSAAPTA